LGAKAQHQSDSAALLKKVIVTDHKRSNPFILPVPVQSIDHETLQQINAESIAEAAKYFSGVLIKDYGGVGGLKTISVRSLGALNTGLVYDGIPVADAQTGQIDLSKYSSTFVQTLELSLANPQQILQPARTYSSAAVLTITSMAFDPVNFQQTKWQAGLKQGSFGLWQPFAGISLPAGKGMLVSANAEALWDKGDYPYYINNGSFSQKATRSNSDIRSLQGEINITKQFSDSSQLQIKSWGYSSDRGLPGSIIFFNNISNQRLWDRDFFVQGRFNKMISPSSSLLVSAKFSSMFTRYRDPDFLNNAGGLDDRYLQEESYLSAAFSHRVGKFLVLSLAADYASTHLSANITPFATPTRTTSWNNIAAQFSKPHWQINASLLNTWVNDQAKNQASTTRNEWAPTIAASYKPLLGGPFLLRFFYKRIFRLPTFNDLYYTYAASVSPKLKPEYAQTYDLGITYSRNFRGPIRQISMSADGYYSPVKDKIITVPAQNLFEWTTENLGKVHIRGLDIAAEGNGKLSQQVKWSLRLAYTWQQALDVTDPTSGEYNNEIPYTPDNSGSAIASLYFHQWTGGYSFLFSGRRYTLGQNNPANELGAWVTHDLFIARNLKICQIQATLKAEADNLFNERYEVINYYPMPGRSYKISISLNNL
jgi:vitamin B12 transporter